MLQSLKNNSDRALETDAEFKTCGITRKFPSYRCKTIISLRSWLTGKRLDDEAEGLWRIHDTIYDFTDFIDKHPGGEFWLRETRGTDITLPFECHHISALPESLLAKFIVRKASKPSNYTLTLHDDGFYRTLKRRVREILPQLKSPHKRIKLMHLSLIIITIGFSLASSITGDLMYSILAGLSLCWLTVASHNFFHQKDNWQMYGFNLSLLNFTNWRLSHALSHHIYPNSFLDLEMALFEPFLCWIPNSWISSKWQRIASLAIQPVAYLLIFFVSFITRLIESLMGNNAFYWHDVIGFMLPLLMWIVSPTPFVFILQQWFSILAIGSFSFGVIGLNAAHHAPEIHHEGDANRTDRDWGLYQLDTVIDRSDIKGSDFLVLTHFGEHALHHLFPTLDHSVLPQLYPIFKRTLKDFDVELREFSHIHHMIGQSRQLLRSQPNLVPPDNKSVFDTSYCN